MPTYRITYRDDRPDELVDGDTVDPEGLHVVIRRSVLVAGRSRDVVVRRLLAVEATVAAVP